MPISEHRPEKVGVLRHDPHSHLSLEEARKSLSLLWYCCITFRDDIEMSCHTIEEYNAVSQKRDEKHYPAS